MKKSKLLWLALILALVMSVSAITAFAAGEPTLTVKTTSLELENAVYMNFKVQSKNISDTSSVKLLVWESYPGKYTKGTEDAELSVMKTEAGTGYLVFQYTDLAAKDMTKFVYVCAYANINGKEYYSNATKFSIVQYAYNAQSDAKLKPLVDSMLVYGASAQTYFNYKTDFLATDPIVKVRVEGGTHADGFKTMYYQKGSMSTFIAGAPAAGMEFSHWENSLGYIVGASSTLSIPVNADDTYTAVYKETGGHSHKVATFVGYEATCTDDGYTDGTYCSDCGEVLSARTVIAAKGHSMLSGRCLHCGFQRVDYTNDSLYASTHGYESLGKMAKGTAMQGFYRELDQQISAFHKNTAMNLDDLLVTCIDVRPYNLTRQEAQIVFTFYRHDHPLYYWLDDGLTYASLGDTLYYIYPMTYPEYMLGSRRAEANATIYEGIEKYANYVHGISDDYTKVLAAHDLIAEAVDYAYDQFGQAETASWAHSILGYFEDKDVVCEGYAKTLQILLNFSGVENIYVVGSSDGYAHAWNLIRLDDGEWYWVDLTWDDNAEVIYNYFCVNDVQFVNWRDDIDFAGNVTFVDEHTPYDIYQEYINLLCYALPERSDHVFSDVDVLEMRETFTVDGATYALIGYQEVRLIRLEGSGTVVVSDRVEYNGKVYTVTEIGAMDSKGFFDSALYVTSNSINKVILYGNLWRVWGNALKNGALRTVIVLP